MANVKPRLHPGDTVAIVKGKDLGKTGKVEKVFPKEGRVLVENINLVKKHVKPKGQQAGGIVSVTKPLPLANVQLVCPSCNKRTRIGIDVSGKEKYRVCKKCKAVIAPKKERK